MTAQQLPDGQGELKDLPHRPASDMKRWREVMAENAGKPVVITNHGAPQAVVLPVATYIQLVRSAQESSPLLTLQQQFDDRLSSLDRHDSMQRVQSAFDATPEEIGKMATSPLFPA